MKIKTLLAIALVTMLSGCAGMPGTADQIITVTTTQPDMSSHCVLSNSIGSWNVGNTPSTISILRDNTPLLISCENAFSRGRMIIAPNHNGMVGFTGQGSEKIAEMSNALPPHYQFQGNNTNAFDGFSSLYPGTLIVPMHPKQYQ